MTILTLLNLAETKQYVQVGKWSGDIWRQVMQH